MSGESLSLCAKGSRPCRLGFPFVTLNTVPLSLSGCMCPLYGMWAYRVSAYRGRSASLRTRVHKVVAAFRRMVRWRPLASPPGVHRQERSPRRNMGALLPRPRRAACRASACHCCCPAVSASKAKTSSRTSLPQSQRQPCTPKMATARGTPAASSARAREMPRCCRYAARQLPGRAAWNAASC